MTYTAHRLSGLNGVRAAAHAAAHAAPPPPDCRACQTGKGLHSCEDFPLPMWAEEYIADWSPNLMPADRDRLSAGVGSILGHVKAGGFLGGSREVRVWDGR